MKVRREEVPVFLAGLAAVLTPVSIAAFEILIGLATVALLVSRARWRIPPVLVPLGIFFGWTVISLAAHSSWHLGYPQIKKFYIFLLLFLVTTAFRSVHQVRWIAWGWALAASLSALWGMRQFYAKYREAAAVHEDFYTHYISSRITGFMGHWMTFSGHMMMALMVIGALLLFTAWRRSHLFLIAAAALTGTGLLLAETRSMWLGAAAGAVYLLWFWKKWTLLALPALLAILVLTNPFALGDRIRSSFQPHGDLDSNAHRAMCRAIGWQMIKAHPLLGVGPEQVGPEHLNYLPPGTKLPLPTGYYGHLHSIYYQYAAERGLPAMLALMWFLARMLYDFILALRRKPGAGRWTLHAAIAVMITVLVGGFYEYNLNDSEVLAMFLAVMGAGYVAVFEGETQTCKA
jgi:O-antigen ligase